MNEMNEMLERTWKRSNRFHSNGPPLKSMAYGCCCNQEAYINESATVLHLHRPYDIFFAFVWIRNCDKTRHVNAENWTMPMPLGSFALYSTQLFSTVWRRILFTTNCTSFSRLLLSISSEHLTWTAKEWKVKNEKKNIFRISKRRMFCKAFFSHCKQFFWRS